MNLMSGYRTIVLGVVLALFGAARAAGIDLGALTEDQVADALMVLIGVGVVLTRYLATRNLRSGSALE